MDLLYADEIEADDQVYHAWRKSLQTLNRYVYNLVKARELDRRDRERDIYEGCETPAQFAAVEDLDARYREDFGPPEMNEKNFFSAVAQLGHMPARDWFEKVALKLEQGQSIFDDLVDESYEWLLRRTQ